MIDSYYDSGFERDCAEADSLADIPKAPGDKCDSKDCDGILEYDEGQKETRNESGIDPAVFCGNCGCEYLPDWSRINPRA